MTARDVFGGYLLFDAWIANTDRHHRNWGLLVHTMSGAKHLAPTFDHSASLGSHETDVVRQERLETRDANRSVAYYVRRNRVRSAFFSDHRAGVRLSMIDAYLAWSGAVDSWLARLERCGDARIDSIFNDMRGPRLSGPAAAFAAAILKENRVRILEAR
jgi:hypothetical protein